jgi:hypothetical protein
VEHYLESIRGEIPSHLHGILKWDFIPWSYVKSRHGDQPNTSLISLLDAYRILGDLLDLPSLASTTIPDDSSGCLRCGSCCSYMRPGAVSGRTYRRWEQNGMPVARFYGPVGKRNPRSSYTSWFNCGVRLRICPFMLINRVDWKPFCCIHHMGREYRPRACSRFAPNPPVCQTGDFVPVP